MRRFCTRRAKTCKLQKEEKQEKTAHAGLEKQTVWRAYTESQSWQSIRFHKSGDCVPTAALSCLPIWQEWKLT